MRGHRTDPDTASTHGVSGIEDRIKSEIGINGAKIKNDLADFAKRPKVKRSLGAQKYQPRRSGFTWQVRNFRDRESNLSRGEANGVDDG